MIQCQPNDQPNDPMSTGCQPKSKDRGSISLGTMQNKNGKSFRILSWKWLN